MKWNASACVRLPVQWHIIQSCIHKGPHSKTACTAWKTAWKKVFKVSSLSSPFSSLCSWRRSWLTYILDHFSPDPKGCNKKVTPGDPFFYLFSSSFILAQSKFFLCTNCYSTTWYKLSQCVAALNNVDEITLWSAKSFSSRASSWVHASWQQSAGDSWSLHVDCWNNFRCYE